MDSPIASWPVRYATHIEGDFVIFQLGEDQICILQPQERRIALIVRGRMPVVAVAKEPEPLSGSGPDEDSDSTEE